MEKADARTARRWSLLIGAIVAEVAGTMMLRATVDVPAAAVGVVVAYMLAFAGLGLALREGMSVGVAYGVWGATGVALTALLGALIFDEILSPVAIVGIAVIAVGVIVVNSGGAGVHDERPAEPRP